MSSSASATFPARFAKIQHTVRTHVRPYHLAVAAVAGLVTVVFLVLIGVLFLISTNFNILGAIE